MSKVCEITEKSNDGKQCFSLKEKNKTYVPSNLFKKRFFLNETGEWVSVKVSAAGLRTITKKGPDAAIKEAREKGL